jgi:hypothetical protein
MVPIGDVDAELGHLAPRDLRHALHVQPLHRADPLAELPPHEEIAGHRHQRHQCQVLVDRADSGRRCGAGRGELHRLALDQDLAGRRLVNARQHLDQGGLAGAVVPQQGMHLAAVGFERDVGQRDDAAEALAEVADLDQGRVAHSAPPVMRRRM